ncbi:hypothetical protein MBHK15_111167 [Marinobacter salarius]|nr:hypothetical protein MBHK15_111167 [Marinobacter salarius]
MEIIRYIAFAKEYNAASTRLPNRPPKIDVKTGPGGTKNI